MGTSVIDANGTGDYLSLAAAAADFNGFAGGATGAATFLIRSDLTEPAFVNFGNDTNGNVVTVKPAPDTTPEVTFTQTTRPGTGTTIFDASFLIGPRGFTSTNLADMTNFTIDGSNTTGGLTRDLSFITPDVGGTQIPRIMVRNVGSDNVIVKNLIIRNGPTGTTDNYCVEYAVRRDANAIVQVPENGQVINCELTANTGGIGQGVGCRGSGTVAAGNAVTNLTVSDCDINVSLRAVLYNINAGGAVTNNRIKVTQFTAGGNNRPEVIRHETANGFTGAYNMEISGNTVSQVHSVATGGFNYVIGVGGGAGGTPTYNIFNNIITGFETTQTLVAPDFLNRAIAITTANSPGTYNIYHNSINMTDLPTIEGVDIKRRLSAISFISASGFTGTFNFENNIVRFSQHNGTLIASSPASGTTPAGVIGGTLNFNNNTYFIENGAQFAFLNDVAYPTLADFQAGTPPRDTASNSADPFAPPAGGKWRSQSDLHFDAVADAVFRGAPQPAVLTDIDGDPRPPVLPTKGADEFVVGSSVNDWTMY